MISLLRHPHSLLCERFHPTETMKQPSTIMENPSNSMPKLPIDSIHVRNWDVPKLPIDSIHMRNWDVPYEAQITLLFLEEVTNRGIYQNFAEIGGKGKS
jgi:hypothetical protein